jgi:hypothetical protein
MARRGRYDPISTPPWQDELSKTRRLVKNMKQKRQRRHCWRRFVHAETSAEGRGTIDYEL